MRRDRASQHLTKLLQAAQRLKALQCWPPEEGQGVSLAMIGDYSGALPKLKDQLDNTRVDDQPLLFVAIQVLFKMHQQDKSLSPDNR